jgi:acetylornithine deacetylase
MRPPLQGGSGLSTYAAHCRVGIERRTLPGETTARVLAEIQGIIDTLTAEDPTFHARVSLLLARDAWEAAADSAIAQVVTDAATGVLGRQPTAFGAPYWMDAALLGAVGIDTVVIGPTGGGAHAAEEWVELESVVQVAQILARAAVGFCGDG